MSKEEKKEEDLEIYYTGFETKAVHSGQKPDPFTGAIMTPISLSSTFAQFKVGVKYPGGYEYSRSGNPTRDAFEKCVASLENGKYGLAFSSGLGATTAITNLLKSGDHIICGNDVYGGTGRYFRKVATKMGIEVDFIDFNDFELFEKTLKKKYNNDLVRNTNQSKFNNF